MRAAKVTVSGGRITSIRDPNLTTVSFGYVAGDTNRIVSRTDRRAVVTSYAFDGGKRVTTSTLNMGTGQAAIVTSTRPAETMGMLPIGAPTAVDTAVVYTLLNGPRTDAGDTTAFWLDRYEEPRWIRNALGYQTLLTRGDSRWPVLVTKIVAPNGRIMGATYDGRGNVASETDSSNSIGGVYATTRYTWDLKWDFVTAVVPPEHDSTVMTYDATNGNRLWQQDARGSVSRDSFFYYTTGRAAGLMRASRAPISGRDSIVCDTLGNLAGTRTPLGFWARSYGDSVGRDTLVSTMIAAGSDSLQRVRTYYDVADRDTLTRTISPTATYTNDTALTATAPETLLVRKAFSPESQIDSLRRRALPDPNNVAWIATQWRYDAAGRAVKEFSLEKGTTWDSTITIYDGASNTDTIITRRGYAITMAYDALNRLLTRMTPSVTQGAIKFTFDASHFWAFPLYRLDATGGLETANDGTFSYTIPGDTARFGYDTVGNIVRADNHDALVRRHYNRSGTLASDTLKVRSYDGADTTTHVYGLRYGYDLDGRRIWMKHPLNVAPRSNGTPKDSTAYSYDPGTGQVATITGVFGSLYTYSYDAEGRVAKLDLTGTPDSSVYDADGRMTVHTRGLGGSIRNDALTYDARDKVVDAQTATDHIVNAYNGSGALTWSQTFKWNQSDTVPVETYTPDAVGNMQVVARRTRLATLIIQPPYVYASSFYEPATGRLDSTYASRGSPQASPHLDASAYSYSKDGTLFNEARSAEATLQDTIVQGQPAALFAETYHYFDADDRLRLLDKRTCIIPVNWSYCDPNGLDDYTNWPSFQENRYDALGRRVFSRIRTEYECPSSYHCYNGVVRSVWDGNALLYEISAPGQTNGLHVDHPLEVVRMEYSDSFYAPVVLQPAPTWHGDYDGAGVGSLPCVTEWVHDSTLTDSSQVSVCMQATWPQRTMWMSKEERARGYVGPVSWMGSIIEGGREPSGQVYMRNRYYDPRSGRFTQEDRLGLAGGINLYGFASGDPVNFNDPFGLCDPFPGCALLAAAVAGDALGTAGALIGSAIEPGGGTAVGLGLGEDLGLLGGFIVATLAPAVSFATEQQKNTGRAEAQIRQAVTHLGGVANMNNDPNNQDPNQRRAWLKHAQKAINNARKFAGKVIGKSGEQLQDIVRRLQELHDHLADQK